MFSEFANALFHFLSPENVGQFTFDKEGGHRTYSVKNDAKSKKNQTYGKKFCYWTVRDIDDFSKTNCSNGDDRHKKTVQQIDFITTDNLKTKRAQYKHTKKTGRSNEQPPHYVHSAINHGFR